MWRYQQECVAAAAEHAVGKVFASVGGLYEEVVYRRHISLGYLHGLAVDECPCRVGIVLERKLLALSVLLKYERCLKLRTLCPLGYLHALLYVGAYVIGAEVELRQGVEAPGAREQDEDNGVGYHYPLVGAADEAGHHQRLYTQHDGCRQQNNVLIESLPVGKDYGVAETSAVFYRVGNGEPQRQRSHYGHEQQHESRHEAAVYGKKNEHAEAELKSAKQHRCAKREIVGHILAQLHHVEIVLQLVLCA